MTTRKDKALEVREDYKAQLERDFKFQTQRRRYYDEGEYKANDGEVYLPWMFSKTLEHHKDTGFAKKVDVESITKAQDFSANETVAKNYFSFLERLKSDVSNDGASTKRRKLEGVAAGNAFTVMGKDPTIIKSDTFYKINDLKGVFDMGEVYVKSLVRDIAFSDFKSDVKVQNYIMWLNEFEEDNITAPMQEKNGEKVITKETFLRGNGDDELEGPYISQFLYLPFQQGNVVINQKYFREEDYIDSVTKDGWLKIQNSSVTSPISLINEDTKNFKYCYNPRILGSMVHNDPVYQFYYNAALISLQNNIKPQGFDNKRLRTTEWTTTGSPDILSSLGHVALGALRVAWYHKWGMGMKIRPEVYAQRIQLTYDTIIKDDKFRNKNLQDDELEKLLQNLKQCFDKMPALLEEVSTKNNGLHGIANTEENKNYYLNLQYPEGSPTHPSHPAGHAVVAGACSTVLKAMFECHTKGSKREKLPWPIPPKHSIDGDTLTNFTDDHNMTIVGEFNKLASNVSLGRDFAGVHYRCDGDCGMKIGEEYAISYLVDKCKEYYGLDTLGLFAGFFLEKFDGEKVFITDSGVESI